MTTKTGCAHTERPDRMKWFPVNGQPQWLCYDCIAAIPCGPVKPIRTRDDQF